jgi:hypothetical protein
MDYFNSILVNRLAIEAGDIQQILFEERSSVLLGSGTIVAFHEKKNHKQQYKSQKTQCLPPQKWGGFTYPGI